MTRGFVKWLGSWIHILVFAAVVFLIIGVPLVFDAVGSQPTTTRLSTTTTTSPETAKVVAAVQAAEQSMYDAVRQSSLAIADSVSSWWWDEWVDKVEGHSRLYREPLFNYFDPNAFVGAAGVDEWWFHVRSNDLVEIALAMSRPLLATEGTVDEEILGYSAQTGRSTTPLTARQER